MQVLDAVSERIRRIRDRYQTDIPILSIERAKFFTKKWQETENEDYTYGIRFALSMKYVYENMTHYIDPDDRIAGYWTEYFLGMPIDIERGVFNSVLERELKKSRIFRQRVSSFFNMFGFLLKKRQLRTFLKNQKDIRSSGTQPLNLGLKTMMEREINPFLIDPKDKKTLLNELLPKWKGKTVIDMVEDRVLNSNLINENSNDFFSAIPSNNSKQTIFISPCATIATYQGHVILDYEKIIRMGLINIKSEIENKIKGENNSKKELDFLQSMRIALEGVIIFATRLAGKIEEKLKLETDEKRKEILKKMLLNCQKVPLKPAESFYEAIQSAWTVKTAVELAHPVNLHCFGRMDQIFYPYYKNDLQNGNITREKARELLEELLLKVMSQNIRPETNMLANFYHRYLGSTPITIGGLKPDGSDGINELTYLFLEAAKNSSAVTNVSLRVNQKTPDAVFEAVTNTISNGCSNISIFNDDVNIEAMKRRGFNEADARNYAIMGCVEMLSPGKTGFMSANALLLCRLLDVTMRNGDALTLMGMIKGVVDPSGDPNAFKTFDEFLDALITQGKDQIKLIVETSNIRDQVFAEYMPAPFISAFMGGCLDSKKDVTEGGSTYNLSGISFINSIANLTDSLYVIKKLIFDEKVTTFSELINALDENFRNNDDLYKKIMSLKGKWGNGFESVDQLARYVTSSLFEETYKYKNFRNGPFVPYVISMITHTIDGRMSIATPDGRKAATPYAASCNPYNVEENGITGAMRSIASLDFEHILGCAVNMKFHPSVLGSNDEKRKKWISLLRTYFKLGGSQIQPTIASAEMLRAAQKDPDSYRTLIVKVGGYSAYFSELGIEIQNEIISRTEHLMS